jgi:hypothetical protein
MSNFLQLPTQKAHIKRSGSQARIFDRLSYLNSSIEEFKSSLSPSSSMSRMAPAYTRGTRNFKNRSNDEYLFEDSVSTNVSSSCSYQTSLPVLSKKRVVSNSPMPSEKRHNTIAHAEESKRKVQFEVGSLYGLPRQVPKVYQEQTVVPVPDVLDIFGDKTKKCMGLDNLLNQEAYHEKESCRFNLKWINSSENLQKL